MSVNVYLPSGTSSLFAGSLSYLLELHVPVTVDFGPYETKFLQTGIRLSPQAPCVLCVGKMYRHPDNHPHLVNFATFTPADAPTDLVVEVSNPSAHPLKPPSGGQLVLIVFCVPLAPVRMDLLCVQRRLDEPRVRGRCPVSILAMRTSKSTLDLEVAASNLAWRPFSRGNRLTASVSLDVSSTNMRRFHIAHVISCSHSDIYVDQVTVVQSSGVVYVSFATKYATIAAPSNIAFKILFREEDDAQLEDKRITFPRYPDPTVCTPHKYGLRVLSPRDAALTPGKPVRMYVSISYFSRAAYAGLFTPLYRPGLSCQIVPWKERQVLSMTVRSSFTTELKAGEPLGDMYFVSRDTLRVKKTSPSAAADATSYSILVHPAETGAGGPARSRRPPPAHRRPSTSSSGAKRGSMNPGFSEFWSEFPPPDSKRARTRSESEKNAAKEQRPPDPPESERQAPTYPEVERFSEHDEALEIVPTGAVFKLKQLIPILLHCKNRDSPITRGPPKKIGRASAASLPSPRWHSELCVGTLVGTAPASQAPYGHSPPFSNILALQAQRTKHYQSPPQLQLQPAPPAVFFHPLGALQRLQQNI
ncbi:M84 [Muromegalovirus WP15B]|uniref:M84 n=1 Tax=Muromegalovirus WP15B TaxID=524651 RepID=B3UXK6_MUHV1|nr:M84 [Muromegalovirus WP15B]